jgi:hypothetical protein
MFDRVYDFFFGDQLRKHVVLISAFSIGQIFVIPLFGWLDPFQYVSLALALAVVSVWPLRLLYDRCFTCREDSIEHDVNNKMLMKKITHHLEQTLYETYSRRTNKIPTEKTVIDIILDLMKSRMLSQQFLQDYERLMTYIFHGITPISGQPPSLDSAKNLLDRLQSLSYANEKTIHELSSYLERALTKNFFALKESGVSDEEIGIMTLDLQSYLYLIVEISNKETQKLIEKYKKAYG